MARQVMRSMRLVTTWISSVTSVATRAIFFW
jgi:hypothetical protein